MLFILSQLDFRLNPQMSTNDSAPDALSSAPSRSSFPASATNNINASSLQSQSHHPTGSQDASNHQELTNLPSVALPYAEDGEAEGDAETEIYSSYPTALESRRHGGSRWFSKELRCLLYGFGDDENPYTGEKVGGSGSVDRRCRW